MFSPSSSILSKLTKQTRGASRIRNFEQKKPIAICITETLLKEEQTKSAFKVSEYHIIDTEKLSQGKRWRRWSLHQDDLNYQMINQTSSNKKKLILAILTEAKENVFITWFYIPPSSVNKHAFNKLTHLEK